MFRKKKFYICIFFLFPSSLFPILFFSSSNKINWKQTGTKSEISSKTEDVSKKYKKINIWFGIRFLCIAILLSYRPKWNKTTAHVNERRANKFTESLLLHRNNASSYSFLPSLSLLSFFCRSDTLLSSITRAELGLNLEEQGNILCKIVGREKMKI